MTRLISICFVLILFICGACSKENRFDLETEAPTDVSACRATFHAGCKKGDNKKIKEKGFCYSSEKIPKYEENTIKSEDSFASLFDVKVTGLTANTHYYMRAFIKFTNGEVIYGKMLEFETNGYYKPGDSGPAKGIIFSTDFSSVAGNTYHEALVSTGPDLPWGCAGVNLFDMMSYADDGQTNTNTINKWCGPGTAAAYCSDLNINGFSDWYLASDVEMSTVRYFSGSYPGLIPKKIYWTSSHYNAGQAYAKNFANDESLYAVNKNTNLAVIAVRSFK